MQENYETLDVNHGTVKTHNSGGTTLNYKINRLDDILDNIDREQPISFTGITTEKI